MRPFSVVRCLLPLVTLGIAINAQTVTIYKTVRRNFVTAVTDTTTYTQTVFEIVTSTQPADHTHWLTITERPRIVTRGTITVTVSAPCTSPASESNGVTTIPPVNQAASSGPVTSEPAESTSGIISETPLISTTEAPSATSTGESAIPSTQSELTSTIPEGTITSNGEVPTSTQSLSFSNSEEASASGTSIPPITQAVSSGSVTTEPVSSSGIQQTTTDEPGASTTGIPSSTSEELGATSSSQVTSTEELGTSSTAVLSTEGQLSSTVVSTEPVTSTEAPISSSSEALSSTIPPATQAGSGSTTIATAEESSTSIVESVFSTTVPFSSTEVVSEQSTTGEAATSTSLLLSSTEPITSTEAPVSTSSEALSSTIPPVNQGVSASSTEPIISTTEGQATSTSEVILSTTDILATSTSELVSIGTDNFPTSTSELLASTTSLIPKETTLLTLPSTEIEPLSTSSGIPQVSGSTTLPEITSFSLAASTTAVLPATTSVNPFDLSCPNMPTSFSVLVDEPGKPVQYLSQLNYPDHGTVESLWGYDTLPLTQSHASAAVFGIGEDSSLTATQLMSGSGITITAAVRGVNLGNSAVQLYTPDHLAADMKAYTATIDGGCRLTLDIPPSGANILAQCGGVLTVLTAAKFMTRVGCVKITLYAIPALSLPATTSTLTQIASSVTASAPLSSFTAPSGCTVAPFFKIIVNEAGHGPQYLYDPIVLGDDALSFTSDSDQSLIFYLNPNDQLSFNIMDFFGNQVVLASEQDQHNPGNEALYFTTENKITSNGYEPVVATVNADCTISLNLPFNAASDVMICSGQLWLRSSASPDCDPVTLLMLPFNPNAETSSLPAATTFLV